MREGSRRISNKRNDVRGVGSSYSLINNERNYKRIPTDTIIAFKFSLRPLEFIGYSPIEQRISHLNCFALLKKIFFFSSKLFLIC